MVNGHGLKTLLHPDVGPLTIEFDVLTPLGDTTQRLVVYRPADAPSKKALDLIAGACSLRLGEDTEHREEGFFAAFGSQPATSP